MTATLAGDLPDGELLHALALMLGDQGAVLSSSTVTVGGRTALRRARRHLVTVGEPPHEAQTPAMFVEYVVAMPGDSGMLVLAFSSLSEPHFDQLVTLFDAIAATLGHRGRPIAASTQAAASSTGISSA